MSSPLYPIFQKRIADSVQAIIQNQVVPWAFLTAGPPFHVKRFDGKGVHYQGIGFEGSPSHVFWGRYIEPFLENLCIVEITAAVEMSKKRQVDGLIVLPEIQGLLQSACKKVFDDMAEIDQRLRGRGYPSSVPRRPIEREYKQMVEFINSHIAAEVAMWKPRSRLDAWASGNHFWKFAIPIGVSVLLWVLARLI